MRKLLYTLSFFLVTGFFMKAQSQCDTTVTSISPDFTTTGLLCTSDSVQFVNNSSISGGTISGYSWDFDDGETSTEENPNHLFFISSGSSFDVKLVVESVQGCKDSVTITIDLNNSPIADFSYEEVCQGDSTPFTNESLLAGGSMTYKWYFGDGSTSTEENPTHLYKGGLSFKAKLIATSNEGCKDSIYGETVYVGSIPISKFTADVQGGYVEFSPGSTGYDGYEWDFGDGNSSTDVSPTHTYTSTGTYDVELTTTTSIGCQSSTTNPVEITSTGIEDDQFRNLKVYPVTFTDAINIEFEPVQNTPASLTLIGLEGKTIYRQIDDMGISGTNGFQLTGLSELPEGIYLLQLQQGSNINVQKVIKVNR